MMPLYNLASLVQGEVFGEGFVHQGGEWRWASFNV